MLQRRDALLGAGRTVWLGGAESPHRTWPGWILRKSRDDVDVQLRNDIAQRANVDLVGIHYPLQRSGHRFNFLEQDGALGSRQVMQLTQILDTRHEDAPRKAVVVHEQQFAQRQPGYRHAISCQPRMQGKCQAGSVPFHPVTSLINIQANIVDQ